MPRACADPSAAPRRPAGARRRRLAALALAAALAACSAPARVADPDPAEALAAWADALREGRPADAWALLAPEGREGLDEAAFLALYGRQRDALVADAEAVLRAARLQPPAERARVRIGDRELELARTRDGWRVLREVGGAEGPGEGAEAR